jgi:serine/threonine-protein kinase
MRDRVTAAVGDAYLVNAEIGRGGMAVVYRATDLRLKRAVAIKVLPPELAFREDVRRRFLREAQTAAQLSHPNIVPIYSVDERDGIVFFVMGLVEGESLAACIARGPMPIPDARRILADVAGALAYAHAHGVVHRDVKPDNILLDRESGRPMVTDFGIARAVEAESRLTVTGIAVGTPAYMSPEQALGEREVDGRSDIYSLGVVAYQALSGVLPFQAGNTPAMMMKHISETPRPLRSLRADVPPALEGAIARALVKRPEDRWPTATAFRDAILRDEAPRVPWQHTPASAPPRIVAPPGSWPPPADQTRAAPQPIAAPAPVRPPPIVAPQALAAQHHADAIQLAAQAMTYRDSRRAARDDRWRSRPLDERITVFRRNLASTAIVVGMLAGINMLTSPEFPWFLFAALGMGASVMKQWSGLWAEGVTWKRIFKKPDPDAVRSVGTGAGAPALPGPSQAELDAAQLAPPDVLAGPHGEAVRRAAVDRATISAIIGSLGKADRDLIPDVAPTVDGLAQRAASIAQMLHHLDRDLSPGAVTQLEQRIAQVKGEPDGTMEHERRLSMLERQHASLVQLTSRRERLVGQLESVGIALQNLKLDLLKLRASGVQSAMGEVNSATVEARALSRDIGHVLEAADEVRKI